MTVLAATGAQIERDFPFGVVRQLFEPQIARADESGRATLLAGAAKLAGPLVAGPLAEEEPAPAADPGFAAVHGLYWLTANLASRGPILLAVDDAHWADEPSLRFLDFLCRRLEGLPAVVAVTARERDPDAAAPLLGSLEQAGHPVFRLGPLSEEAAEEFLRAELDGPAEAPFAIACHTAAAGNPFLLGELAKMVRSERIEPTAENARAVGRLTPASVSRSVLARLGRLDRRAVLLARAVAVLDGGGMPDAARLAALDAVDAEAATETLIAADIVGREPPLRFIHPMAQWSVYNDIAISERSVAHREAANILAERNAEPAAVAAHLLNVAPAGDGWVVEQLRAAAASAAERRAPEVAARMLERAVAEPPPPELAAAVLRELAVVQAHSNAPEAATRLRQALDLASDAGDRAQVAIELARTLMLGGRPEEAIEVLEATAGGGELGDELRSAVEGLIFVSGYVSLPARKAALARLAAHDSGMREIPLPIAALETTLRSGPAEDAAGLAHRALGRGRLIARETSDSPVLYAATNALLFTHELGAADDAYSAAIRDAEARGSLRGMAIASAWRAGARAWAGRLLDAEADARVSLGARMEEMQVGLPVAVAFLIWALVDRGELAAAEAALEESRADAVIADSILFLLMLEARGRLRLAQGRTEEALKDFLACGPRERAWGVRTPSMTLWRLHAARALAAKGQASDAERLVLEELERAEEFGSRRALGMSLAGLGLLRDGEEGRELLRRGASELARSDARLDEARALLELGSALRRNGEREAARSPLKEALSIARSCNATPVAERAHSELEATGARPRKILRSGAEALTASERRVAAMAAEGMSNREIAQALFVTVKTVETHLGRAFKKLDIGSRSQLANLLTATEDREGGAVPSGAGT